MRRVSLKKGAVPGAIVALVGAMVASVVASAAPSSQGGPTLRVYAGDGSGTVTMNDFRMPTVRVAQGTTVTWVGGSDEPHTVTFVPPGMARPQIIVPQPEDPSGRPPMLNPDVFFPRPATGPYEGTTYVNSGFLEKGQDFSINFGRQGRFDYVCILHEPMVGVVEVVAPGSSGISTQAEIDEYNVSHTSNVHAPQIAEMLATRTAVQASPGAGGTTIYAVRVGTEWRYGHAELLQFLPETITVQQGDTVLWFNDAPPTPHTVTFSPEGQQPPDFLVPTLPDGTVLTGPPPDAPAGGPPPDPSMQPRLVLGPATAPIRPSPTHDGRSLYNSGIIGDFNPAGQATWALTFDVPGTFRYTCVVHPGMDGTVIVNPR